MSQERTTSEEQRGAEYYLPGTPAMSPSDGRLERFLKTLFRRRGRIRADRQHERSDR
ncbi:hypothetical protein [Halostagnicola sp. A-GB9-2]|uniref:hypothetical protein n=1 Tax=Halostagnicola sp. A-GB9-2 TaxID=3048066 RepID=UPI0024C02B3C|nr:hypothetical protein [Halostagnicola sp. A-GB9-2]MDJ1434674.1 hypothetical protein [Halostagnicola sp. A-GB9-2]